MSRFIGVETNFDGLAAHLAERARVLAAAHLRSRAMAARADERRWRRAGLLWPLFARGPFTKGPFTKG